MSFFTALIGSKIAIGALALGTVAVGGTAATAYTGSLPAPLQQAAHSLIGAPAPVQAAAAATAATTDPAAPADPASPGPSPDPSAIPPAAPADPAATPAPNSQKPDHRPGERRSPVGLCEAYAHGSAQVKAAVYPDLVAAASTSADIATYCDTVVKKDHKKAEKAPEQENTPDSQDPSDESTPAPASSDGTVSVTAPGASHVPDSGKSSHDKSGNGENGDD
jgi:hypothetical protein